MLIIILLVLFVLATLLLAAVCLNMHKQLKVLKEANVKEQEVEVRAPVVLPESIEPAGPETNAMSATILIVGDDINVSSELVKNLSDEYELLTAVDGNEGLQLACEANPDIVLADAMCPGLSGYELCSRLRENVETSHIAIILYSALCERENVIYGLEAGADDFITLPFDMAILRSRIHTIMKRHQSYRENPLTPNALSKVDYKSKLDKAFMDKVMGIIEERLPDSEFTINELCSKLAMSRTSVFNKIKALTGKSPNDVIKVMRLNKAHELLLTRELNVAEVAFKVGFADPKYFSTCFKKQFGVSPNKV